MDIRLFLRTAAQGGNSVELKLALEVSAKAVQGDLQRLAQALDEAKVGRPALRHKVFEVAQLNITCEGTLHGSALSGAQHFPIKLDVPGVLLDEDPSGALVLRKPDDLAGDLKALDTLAQAKTTAAAKDQVAQMSVILASARTALASTLARLEITLGAGAQQCAFFGCTQIFGSASVNAGLSIDLEALLRAAQGEPPSGQPVLRAQLTARIGFEFNATEHRAGQVELTCQVNDVPTDALSRLVELITQVDLPTFEQMPWLGFDLPAMPFPDLSLDGLSLGDPVRLFDFGLPLPNLHLPSPPLKVTWATSPELKFSVLDGELSIATSTEGAASIEWTLANPPLWIAGLSHFKIQGANDRYQLSGSLEINGSADHVVDAITGIGAQTALPVTVDLDDMHLVFNSENVDGTKGPLTLDLATGKAVGTLSASIVFPKVVIRAKDDPRLLLAFKAKYQVSLVNTRAVGRLTELSIIDPYPLELIAVAAETVIEGVVRLVGLIQLPGAPSTPIYPGLPAMPDASALVDRLGKLLAASLKWMARHAGQALGAAAGVLGSLVEATLDLIGRVLELLGKGAKQVFSYVAVEVRIDARSCALKQLLITPVENPTHTDQGPIEALAFAGLELIVPAEWAPTLLLDFSRGLVAALLVSPKGEADSKNVLELSTDLWLKRADAPVEAVRDTDLDGVRPKSRLLQLRGWKKKDTVIALAVLEQGKLSFFQSLLEHRPASESLKVDGGVTLTIGQFSGTPTFTELRTEDFDGSLGYDLDKAKRLLPFFGTAGENQDKTPGKPAGKLMDKLNQYVEVEGADKVQLSGSSLTLPLKAIIHLDAFSTALSIRLKFDLNTLTARLEADEACEIRGKPEPGDLFGLTYLIRPKSGKLDEKGEFAQFALDFSAGAPRMALHKDAEIDLFYSRLGGGGRGLVFKVSEFVVGQGLFDIVAEVDPSEPVTLPGVDMPFRFDAGKLVVKRGEIQAFSINGSGQLPPELVGQANCKVTLSLGREPGNGRLAVLACDAQLDKTQSPIVCHATRFELTITKLGFALVDMAGEGGYQFYFQVTGSLVFAPVQDEFADTFLKHLRGLKISLNKAPLARDISRLARAISFQIPIEPRVTFNLFDVFAFELRGIGYLGSCEAFGGDPALVICGQARLTPNSDTISARIDLHNMYISTQVKGARLPRVRFDGLGVSLSMQAGTVEATAIAVDGNLPTLYPADVLPAGIKARGFLASGRLNLKSWASMSASMGFLELEDAQGDKRHAFFLYGEMGKLSTEIPTPVKPIYLREMGFGIGYRYTLAGLRRADAVTTPQALVEVLDDVSRYQNDLARFEAWEPEATGDRLTLALRAMLSLESASQDGSLSDDEAKLPNLLLMDVAAALRSDLTFLMTVRAWLCVNYADWANATDRQSIASRPTLRGYLYLSAPRQEFLARLLSDPNGLIGEHPKLPEPMIMAFRAVTWSATLYTRPGLFHYELGWPYELKFEFTEDAFGITCEGGMVMRIEDASILYGIAFRAKGFARIGGKVGGRSLGASAVAEMDFALDAKFIALISLKQPSDTLFYGSLAFSCTVNIEVRVWMEIDLGFDEIRIEIGQRLSRTLSLALEVAVQANGVAGRGAASMSFAAFGRTLSLSIGFAFDEPKLEQARQRVARFLTLGLSAAIPNPEQGLAPPPAQPPAKNDPKLEQHADKHAVLSEVEDEQPEIQPQVWIKIGGDEVGQPRFWAMLFEIPASPGNYVMQLIPRDHTEIDAALTLPQKASTFFAHPGENFGKDPNAATPAYELKSTTALQRLLSDGTQDQGSSLDACYSRPLAVSDKGKPLLLHHLLEQCFVPDEAQFDKKTGQVTKSRLTDPPVPKQPGYEAIHAKDSGAHATAEKAAEDLRLASSDMMKLSLKRAQWRATEERRSSVIASVVASAQAIARQTRLSDTGAMIWPTRPQPLTNQAQLDARDLGLTFWVDETALGALFNLEDASAQLPPKSTFTVCAVGTSNLHVEAQPNSVYLFNPPRRFFDRANPQLRQPRTWFDAQGVGLDWDLEPGWGESGGIWNDPEFHLQHYEIERLILVGASVASGIAPISVQTKASAPLAAEVQDRTVSWRRIRPLAQFIDDFADLPATVRPAFRKQGQTDLQGYKAILDAFNELRAGGDKPLPVRIVYTVVPVDITGHRGTGLTITHELARPVLPQTALGKVEWIARFVTFPGLPGAGLPTLLLRIDDLLDRERDDQEQPQRLPARGTRFLLKVRPERAMPLGEFAADSMGMALQRPGPAEFERSQQGDQTFELELLWPAGTEDSASASMRYRRLHGLDFIAIGGPASNLRLGFADAGRTQAAWLNLLLSALGIDDSNTRAAPLPVRCAVKRTHRPRVPNASVREADVVACPSPWIAVDMALRVETDQADRLGRPIANPVDMPVEVFECPLIAGYLPLEFADLDARAGRLLIDYPGAHATLADLTHHSEDALSRQRDGERRIATQLRWATCPRCDAPGYIGGYDVFEIDLGSVIDKDEQIAAARHVARARLLDPRVGKADPAGIEDFAAVEAFYPSETLRLEQSGGQVGMARRRAWYTGAESLLAWARPTLRRSVGLAVDEVDLAALFDKGRPTVIEVAWSARDSEPALKAPEFYYDGSLADGTIPADAIPGPFPFDTFTNDKCWTVGAVRKLLNGLVLAKDAQQWAKEGWVEAYVTGSDANRFNNLSLTLTGKRGKGITGQTSVVVDLDQRLHPLLVDVVDALRWDWVNVNAPYRRYRPVLEAAPATKVTQIEALLDERPAERDPYGWAVLRTLGLAQGLRLFDMTTADYVLPRDTLSLVEQACGRVLKRYAGMDCGVPLIDLFARPDGLMSTSSFDGGMDQVDVKHLLDDELVCMIQLSLRPVPEAMRRAQSAGPDAWGNAPVRYFAVTLTPESDAKKDNSPVQLDTAALEDSVLIDLLDPSGTVNGGKVITLAKQTDGPAAQSFAGGRSVSGTLSVERNGQVLLLRVISPTADGQEQAFKLFSERFAPKEHRNPFVSGDHTGLTPNCWGHFDDPFEQFPTLDAQAVTTLVQGNGLIAANAQAKGNFADFAWYAWRAFKTTSEKVLPDSQRSAVLKRWPGFIDRYLVHGLAHADSLNASSIPFALATLTQTAPLRLVPDVDGTMHLLLLHKDRFARRRRYVVRPLGRYDALLAAWDAAMVGVDPDRAPRVRLPWVAQPALADSFVELVDDRTPAAVRLPQMKVKQGADPLSNCSVDVIMPRTEPLADPVVLSAKRLDAGTGTERRPGRLLEFVVARHPEEIAAEANIHLADALQFEHQAFGFWREFAEPRWGRAFGLVDCLPALGASTPVKPGALMLTGPTLAEIEQPYAGGKQVAATTLPERFVDGWRGITVLRTQSVPHFYRLHMAVFAAAGVVVSRPIAAVIPEGGYQLGWSSDDPDKRPAWQVVRDDTKVTAVVTLRIPLVRNLDGMHDADRSVWINDPQKPPEVFLLPDPQVVYELSTRIVAGAGDVNGLGGERSPEIEFLAKTTDADAPAYVNRVAGTGFQVDEQTPVSRLQTPNLPWWLCPELRGPRTVPAAPPPTALLDQQLNALGTLHVAPAEWATANAPWPLAHARVTIKPPPAPRNPVAWKQWQGRLAEVEQALAGYLPAPAVGGAQEALWAALVYIRRFLAVADQANHEDEAWRQLTLNRDIVAAQADMAWPAGLPLYPSRVEGLVPAIENTFFSCVVSAPWQLPPEQACTLDARLAMRSALLGARRRIVPGDTATPFAGPTADQVLRDYLAAAWAYDVHPLRVANSAAFGGFAPVVRTLTPDLQAGQVAGKLSPVAATPALMSAKAIFEFVAPVTLRLANDDANLNQAAYKALVTALQTTQPVPGQGEPGLGFYPALEALAKLEQPGLAEHFTLELRLPGASLDPGHPVRQALDTILNWTVGSLDQLVLRRPPTQADLNELDTAGANPALKSFITQLAADQLFGPSRRPFLKASKGLADPIVTRVERAP